MLTPQIKKVDANGGTRVYLGAHKQSRWRSIGEGTIVITSDDTRELNCVSSGGHATSFSARSTLRKIGEPPSKKQVRVRYCHNADRRFRAWEGKAPLFMKTKKQVLNRQRLVRLSRRMEQWRRLKKLLSMSKIWTCSLLSNWWETHRLYSRWQSDAKTWAFTGRAGRTSAHMDSKWQDHQLQVGKIVF